MRRIKLAVNSYGKNFLLRGRKLNLFWWLRPHPSLIVKYFSFKLNSLVYIFISNNKWLGYINHVNQIGTERGVCFWCLSWELKSCQIIPKGRKVFENKVLDSYLVFIYLYLVDCKVYDVNTKLDGWQIYKVFLQGFQKNLDVIT